MAVQNFDKAIVKNLTKHTQTLRSGDGDSVTIMPGAQVPIMHKFLLWQPPAQNVIRVMSVHLIPKKESAKSPENVENVSENLKLENTESNTESNQELH